VEILTYCVMSNHFHVLVRVPEKHTIPDAELLRRFKVLYPKPTKYQTVEFARLETALREGNEDAVGGLGRARRGLLRVWGDRASVQNRF
jgi:REP element-mobilizing transposase RayT